MTTRVADRVLLDTTILLAATDADRTEFAAAQAALNTWPGNGTTLYTSGQVLREYLCVATRPVERNGLGVTRETALTNTRTLGKRLHLLAEDEKVHARLLALLEETECCGKQVHDANIVATMLVHGIDAITTLNIADFTRFENYIRLVPLC